MAAMAIAKAAPRNERRDKEFIRIGLELTGFSFLVPGLERLPTIRLGIKGPLRRRSD
jgi:hypothetical protein